jgi:DNA-binding response OmpR family regulator
MARILVVDDDPDVLRIVEKVLSINDHLVFSAQSAMKAMELLNSTMFDMLISDANMPGFSGFDLIRTIRNNRKFQKMSVAMLTGLREKKHIEQAVRAGVDDYIIKPIDPQTLLRKVEIMFEKRPPMERALFQFSDAAKFTDAKCKLDIKVLSISEIGLSFRANVELAKGMTLELQSEVFKKIGIPAPAMRVIGCKKLAEYEYEIRVAFLGISENTASHIRGWIHSQPGSKRSA